MSKERRVPFDTKLPMSTSPLIGNERGDCGAEEYQFIKIVEERDSSMKDA